MGTDTFFGEDRLSLDAEDGEKVSVPIVQDTIAAVSTPAGRGAISIVRLSGPAAVEIADRLSLSSDNGAKPSRLPSHHLHLSSIVDPRNGREIIDRALVAVMRAPNSYTGCDVVEIHCHGSPVVTRRIMAAAVAGGARPAQRGEFTRQALLNGRMDLTQAEALVDLINASGRAAAGAALRGLEGETGRRIGSWWDRLAEVLAEIEVRLDFPEEEMEPIDLARLREEIEAIRGEIGETVERGRSARALAAGFHVAIAGPPNSGKSTLLNGMIGWERAIVSDIPGTTRDTVEDELEIGGVLVRLADTAGLRETGGDRLEAIAAGRSRKAVEAADLVLYLVDGGRGEKPGRPFGKIDRDRRILVVNKIDLTNNVAPESYRREFPGEETIGISALDGTNVAALIDLIGKRTGAGDIPADGPIVTRARQLDLLERTGDGLGNALKSMERGDHLELTACELREAAGFLAEITGRGITGDVLDRIFETFCIGK